LTLINNPEKYFGKETKIIYVKADNSYNKRSLRKNNIESLNLDEINKTTEIDSGTKITINGLSDWIFMPYNYEFKQNQKDLINKLQKKEINTTKLTIDPKYTLDEIVKDISTSKIKAGKIFKDIYDSLDGKINQNSMFVYSGPMQEGRYQKYCYFVGERLYTPFCYHEVYCCYHNHNKVGCIYTGDGNLNIVDIKSVYKNYWKNVGTIQVPHHGELKSFNNEVLKDNHYCCPISVEKNNSYGHPSVEVIGDILSSRSCPILVTEELDSLYIEIIE
jgi:hypothetical protein